MIDGVTTITLDMGWSIMALILLAVGLALACGYLAGAGWKEKQMADEIKTDGLIEKYAGMEGGEDG